MEGLPQGTLCGHPYQKAAAASLAALGGMTSPQSWLRRLPAVGPWASHAPLLAASSRVTATFLPGLLGGVEEVSEGQLLSMGLADSERSQRGVETMSPGTCLEKDHLLGASLVLSPRF